MKQKEKLTILSLEYSNLPDTLLTTTIAAAMMEQSKIGIINQPQPNFINSWTSVKIS